MLERIAFSMFVGFVALLAGLILLGLVFSWEARIGAVIAGLLWFALWGAYRRLERG